MKSSAAAPSRSPGLGLPRMGMSWRSSTEIRMEEVDFVADGFSGAQAIWLVGLVGKGGACLGVGGSVSGGLRGCLGVNPLFFFFFF